MKKKIGIAFLVILVVFAGLYGLYCYEYPYGMDHRCEKSLYLELLRYAKEHDGAFPLGEPTPEASISLISKLEGNLRCGCVLRRRDVSMQYVDEKLQRGELLGPETCGWNYVEGLRTDSNPELALFWDKEGLTEMGMRLSGGGHDVIFLTGASEHIPESLWKDFMENQKKLLAEEMAKREKK